MKKILILLSLIPFGFNAFTQGDKLVFDEEFNDNNAEWWVGDDEIRKGEIKKGVYNLTNKDPKKTSIPRVSSAELDKVNFTVEIKLKHISGAENSYFGLRYGHSDSYKMDFGISSNGYFFVREFYNGKFHLVTPLGKLQNLLQDHIFELYQDMCLLMLQDISCFDTH